MALHVWIKDTGTPGHPEVWAEIAGTMEPSEDADMKLLPEPGGLVAGEPLRVQITAVLADITQVPKDDSPPLSTEMNPAEHLAWLAFQESEPMPSDSFTLLALKKVFHAGWVVATGHRQRRRL